MVVTLIGKRINDGVYNGTKYHNLSLFVTYPQDVPASVPVDGIACEIVKVKRDPDFLFRSLQVGKKYRIYYDRFKNVEEIIEDRDSGK